MASFASAAAAQVTIPVTVSGNVADNDANNLGDNSGAAGSTFISAGIFSSGTPGNNGTSRMHFEFPIASLGTGPVPVATVQITSFNSGFETLDTFFFAATIDGNGTIENSDFEIASAAVPSSTMLLSSNAGGDATHTFDVTSQLNAALAAGRNFLVIQGRVDETIAGPGYQRGLEVYSHIASDSTKRPVLVVSDVVVIGPPPKSVPVPGPGAPALAAMAVLLALAGSVALARRKPRT